MSFRLVYSPEALGDLDRVWSEVYEASQDFDTADRYVADMMSAVGRKRNYPKTGTPLYYMDDFTGIYYVSFKAYLVFYRVHDDKMEVGRILYAKSDYLYSLFGKSEYHMEDEED